MPDYVRCLSFSLLITVPGSLVAYEDPPIRGPMPYFQDRFCEFSSLTLNFPWTNTVWTNTVVVMRLFQESAFFTICLGTSFAHQSLRTSRWGINKETTNLYYSVRMKQRLNIAISNLLQENRKEQDGIRGSSVCPLRGPVR